MREQNQMPNYETSEDLCLRVVELSLKEGGLRGRNRVLVETGSNADY